MTVDVDITRKYLATLSGKLVELSEKFPPPFENAANGYFHDAFLDDDVISSLQATPDGEDMSDEHGHSLYSLSRYFRVRLIIAFNNRSNYYTNWTQDIHLAWDQRAIVADIARICVGIVKAVLTDGAEIESAIASIQTDVADLVRRVTDKGTTASGVYMNGYISADVRDAAAEVEKALNIAWDDQTGPTAAALSNACHALTLLPTDGHTPWLRAEWQIKFQAIMMALNVAVR